MQEKTEEKRPFSIQDDDKEIVSHLHRYRYLQTRQIHDLLPNRKPVAIRRRLRKMVSNGWVACLERSQTNGLTNNHAYTLGPHGLEWIAGNLGCRVDDLPFSKKAAKIGPVYLDHAIMVNDARILVERALEYPLNTDVVMTRWISEHDLRSPSIYKKMNVETRPGTSPHGASQAQGKDKKRHYVLYEKFSYGGKAFFFKPDAAFFSHKKDGDKGKQMMFCLEADRGTEAVRSVIRQKLIGYNLFHSEGKGAAFENFGAFRVLFILQSPTERRISTLRSSLADMKGAERLRFALQRELSPNNFFKEKVWYTIDGQRVPLMP